MNTRVSLKGSTETWYRATIEVTTGCDEAIQLRWAAIHFFGHPKGWTDESACGATHRGNGRQRSWWAMGREAGRHC